MPGNAIASLFVSIGADLGDLKSGLADAEGSLGSAAANFAKVGLGVGLAAGAAIGGGILASIGEAMESQEALAGLDAVLKSTGEAAAAQAEEYERASKIMVSSTALSGKELEVLNEKLEKAQARVTDLSDAMSRSKNPTASMALNLERAQEAVEDLQQQIAKGGTVMTQSLAKQMKLVPPAIQPTREELLELADQMQSTTKFSDEMVVGAEKVMLTFRNIGADIFPEAIRAASDMSTVMGTDLQSSVVMLGKALNDPIAGITALTRVGVSFTEEQKKMIKGLVESGDILGAQTLIIQELKAEFGGAAKAAGDTFAGKLVILGNKFSDLQEIIGGAFLPALTMAADGLIGFLSSPEVQGAIQGLLSWFTTELPNAIQGLAEKIPTGVLDTFRGMGLAAQEGFMSFKSWLDENGPLITEQAIAMGTGIKEWFDENGPTLTTGADLPFTRLREAIAAVWTEITTGGSKTKTDLDFILSAWNVTMEMHQKDFDKVKTKIVDGWNAIQRAIGRSMDKQPVDDFTGTLDRFGIKLPSIVTLFSEFADSMVDLGEDIAEVLNGIAAAIDAIVKGAQAARDFFDGMGGGNTPPPSPIPSDTDRRREIGGRGRFGGEATIILNYAPTVSLMDEAEAQTKLIPFIREALRA